jgi:phosphatidylserine/phosphatidylglycerophosphate/cardiolipin synthase-like enzyme
MFAAALAAFSLTPAPPPAGPLSLEPTIAGVRLFYGPGGGFDGIDARLVARARKSIDMAAYVLTDRSLAAALGEAGARGVKVRIYLDGEDSDRAAAVERLAFAPNVEIRRKAPSRDLMHLKSYSVDGRLLRSGSANFSVSGAAYQDNDLIVIESPAAATAFEEAFERLWRRSDNRRIGMK